MDRPDEDQPDTRLEKVIREIEALEAQEPLKLSDSHRHRRAQMLKWLRSEKQRLESASGQRARRNEPPHSRPERS